MKTENQVPSIQDSALRTRHSVLRWGEAMKNIFSILLIVAVVVVGGNSPGAAANESSADRTT